MSKERTLAKILAPFVLIGIFSIFVFPIQSFINGNLALESGSWASAGVTAVSVATTYVGLMAGIVSCACTSEYFQRKNSDKPMSTVQKSIVAAVGLTALFTPIAAICGASSLFKKAEAAKPAITTPTNKMQSSSSLPEEFYRQNWTETLEMSRKAQKSKSLSV